MYFVTICTRNRDCLFGEVVGREMQLNDSGRIVTMVWEALPDPFSPASPAAFVIMPNHIHGILMVGAQFIAPQLIRSDDFGKGAMNRAPTLGKLVRAYKAASTREIRKAANPDFAWQRNYYEHIIRDEPSLNRIQQYIVDNPARWAFDRENPAATIPEPVEPWRA